jgi:hypothetical protein
MILGIDPGKTGGWCIGDSDKRNTTLFGKIDTHDLDALKDLALYAKERGVLTCYIEDVHFQSKKFNPKTLLNHAKSIGLTEGIMWSHGIQTHLVLAKVWQSQVLVVNGRAQHGKGASVEFANRIGVETRNHNIADAACIAAYGQQFHYHKGAGK